MKLKIAILACVAALTGCQSLSPQNSASELSGVWQVKSIDRNSTLQRSIVTMDFSQVVSKVVGSTGCNQYSALIETSGHEIKVGQAVMTKMACVPDIASQEQVFLRSLASISHYKMMPEQQITFYDKSSQPRLVIKQLKSE